jgi:hypothetical protein
LSAPSTQNYWPHSRNPEEALTNIRASIWRHAASEIDHES